MFHSISKSGSILIIFLLPLTFNQITYGFFNKFTELARYIFTKTKLDIVKEENITLLRLRNKNQQIGYIQFESEYNRGYINSLYINKEFRNQGHASYLLKKAIAMLRQDRCKAIGLYVQPFETNEYGTLNLRFTDASLARLKKLYYKHGFKEDSKLNLQSMLLR